MATATLRSILETGSGQSSRGALALVGPAAVAPGAERPALARARLHEALGPARRSFALLAMGAAQEAGPGPVIWIRPTWQAERLNPEGMVRWCAPGRVIFVDARRPDDMLWTLEEVLRSGAVGLAVADMPGRIGLTAVRRLHLAAEAGAGQGHGHVPLGLVLTPEPEDGSPGVESRWQMVARHAGGPSRWRLARLRARRDPPRAWTLTRDRQRLRLAPAEAPDQGLDRSAKEDLGPCP